MIRLVQLQEGERRCVALVEEPRLRLLGGTNTVYGLVQSALEKKKPLVDVIADAALSQYLEYDAIYRQLSSWRIVAPIDHPSEPSRCLISGSDLTHLGTARNRQSRPPRSPDEELTDSRKIVRWGIDQGRPPSGAIGAAPEWFFKGTGNSLRGHGAPLEVPPYAENGSEEGEIAGIYVIDSSGRPCRVGLAIGNDFSDHRLERQNSLYLAGSKIRPCSLGPEIVIDADFSNVPGEVTLERGGIPFWSKAICTGEAEMCHSLANLEHHHFKFEIHRRPGDVHVHYFGAHSHSFDDGIPLTHGDVMTISFESFGRPLRNPLHIAAPATTPVSVRSLA